MRRRVLLIALCLSSCLLPRVDFDSSLGSAGNSSGGGGGAAAGGTGASGTNGSAGAQLGQGGKSGSGNAGGNTNSAGSSDGTSGATQTGGRGGVSGGTAGAGTSGIAGASAGTSASAGGASGGTGGSAAGASGCGALAVSSEPQCCVASAPTTGVSNTLAIDDLEDDDNSILPIAERQGYWFVYNDGTSTQMPSTSAGPFQPTAGNGHPCSLVPVPPACAGVANATGFSAATSGTLVIATDTVPSYAGMGFDFNNRFIKSCAYDAGAYHGISFWAKGNVPIRAMIKIPATTATSDSASAGICTTNCEDHYGILVSGLDSVNWKQFTITFGDKTTFAQAGWGAAVPFDPSALLAVQFQVTGTTTATTPTAYSFAVDDIAFIP